MYTPRTPDPFAAAHSIGNFLMAYGGKAIIQSILWLPPNGYYLIKPSAWPE